MKTSSFRQDTQDSHAGLAELIGSRICHDLIGPLGAISNGLELMGLDPVHNGPEFDLVSQSIELANSKTRLFRVAFGAAGVGQPLNPAELEGILDGLNRHGRIQIDWLASRHIDRQTGRIVFLLVLAFECAMPRGGRLEVRELAGEWSLTGTSEHLLLEPELWQVLSREQDASDIPASRVQFAIAPICAAAMDRRLVAELSDEAIRVRF